MGKVRFNLNPTEGDGDDVIFKEIAAQSKALSKPHPEIEAIFEKHGRPRPFLPTREQIGLARKGMAGSVSRFMKSPFVRETLARISDPECSTKDVKVAGRPGSAIPIRIYVPGGTEEPSRPVLVMGHSGGFCTGDLNTEEFICRLLCRSVGLIVIDVDYRLAPEHELAVQRADLYDVVKWVSQNAKSFGGDLTKGFLVGGVSAGAVHALNVVYDARDEQLIPNITGTLIISMGVVHILKDAEKTRELFPGRFPSYEENRDAPFTGQATNECYGVLSNARVDDPRITPLYRADHSNLPPMYYQIAGMDLLRDASIYYAHLVRKAGCVCRTEIYPGLPHTWWILYSQNSQTQKWAQDLVEGTKWLLQEGSKEVSRARL